MSNDSNRVNVPEELHYTFSDQLIHHNVCAQHMHEGYTHALCLYSIYLNLFGIFPCYSQQMIT